MLYGIDGITKIAIGAVLIAITPVVVSLIVYSIKTKLDISLIKNEAIEIQTAMENARIGLNSSISENIEKNVIRMMQDNVEELREYYVISKQQARKSFSASLFACTFGFCIYVLGIISSVFFETDANIIAIIGGTASELIAALFFWLYREATKQLSIYHQRLGSTEKYLTVIQIIKDLPEDKQYEQYSNLIEHILLDNQEIVKHDYAEKDMK